VSVSGKAITSLLLGDATLEGMVGHRIRLVKLDQEDVYPAIVCHLISNNPSNTKDGSSQADLVRWQVSSIAESMASAITIAERVRTVLDGLGATTINGINVDGIVYMDEVTLPYNDKNDLFQVAQDYQIRVRR